MSALRQMKDIGVREFRDHATRYLSGSDTLAIRKNGHLIGFYIPIKRDQEKVRQAVESLERTVDRIVDENGDIDDRLGEMFDLYRPRKRDEEKVREAWERFGQTMERIRKETGMTEDEFADMFDLNKPFPE
jgi:hypothetical protein